jgi:hypothetical protein
VSNKRKQIEEEIPFKLFTMITSLFTILVVVHLTLNYLA